MKEFMLIYQGGDPEWMQNQTEADMQALMQSWGAWMAKLQEQGHLVNGGAPLHFGGQRLTSDGVVTDIAAAEFKELVSGYSIIKAESFEQAVSLTKACPIFQNPACVTEIREILQMG